MKELLQSFSTTSAWFPIVSAIIASAIFEIIKAFVVNRKPKLVHDTGSDVSYTIKGVKHFFLTINLKNEGTIAARNVSLSLKTDSLENVEVEVNSTEVFTKECSGERTFFKFERTLPGDKIDLVLRKENERLDISSLVIRSDEVESINVKSSEKKALNSFFSTLVSIFIPVLVIFVTAQNFLANPKDSSTQTSLAKVIDGPKDVSPVVSFHLDKDKYRQGEDIPYTITVLNKSDQVINGIRYYVDVPGSDKSSLDGKKDFLSSGEAITINGKIKSDETKKFPKGQYSINLMLWGKTATERVDVSDKKVLEIAP